ncbi:hypothetical protein [Streptosporangium sp. NPDC023615]|uniref:hypothetical protein n=1 Tax=Streptosporangium sp. NPDC023615 TaxID=3154794 RepID=UPI00341D985C
MTAASNGPASGRGAPARNPAPGTIVLPGTGENGITAVPSARAVVVLPSPPAARNASGIGGPSGGPRGEIDVPDGSGRRAGGVFKAIPT